MAQEIIMTAKGGAQGGIVVERLGDRDTLRIIATRPDSPTIGFGLTRNQVKLLIEAIKIEMGFTE